MVPTLQQRRTLRVSLGSLFRDEKQKTPLHGIVCGR